MYKKLKKNYVAFSKYKIIEDLNVKRSKNCLTICRQFAPVSKIEPSL